MTFDRRHGTDRGASRDYRVAGVPGNLCSVSHLHRPARVPGLAPHRRAPGRERRPWELTPQHVVRERVSWCWRRRASTSRPRGSELALERAYAVVAARGGQPGAALPRHRAHHGRGAAPGGARQRLRTFARGGGGHRRARRARSRIRRTIVSARLVLIWPTYLRLASDGQAMILKHELTHLISAPITSGRTPAWLPRGAGPLRLRRPAGRGGRARRWRCHPRIPLPPDRHRPAGGSTPGRGLCLRVVGRVLYRAAFRAPGAPAPVPRLRRRADRRGAGRARPTRRCAGELRVSGPGRRAAPVDRRLGLTAPAGCDTRARARAARGRDHPPPSGAPRRVDAGSSRSRCSTRALEAGLAPAGAAAAVEGRRMDPPGPARQVLRVGALRRGLPALAHAPAHDRHAALRGGRA